MDWPFHFLLLNLETPTPQYANVYGTRICVVKRKRETKFGSGLSCSKGVFLRVLPGLAPILAAKLDLDDVVFCILDPHEPFSFFLNARSVTDAVARQASSNLETLVHSVT